MMKSLSTKQMVILQGVAHTAKGAVGVSLMGIEPLKEISISFLPDSIVAGEYLSARRMVDGQLSETNLLNV